MMATRRSEDHQITPDGGVKTEKCACDPGDHADHHEDAGCQRDLVDVRLKSTLVPYG